MRKQEKSNNTEAKPFSRSSISNTGKSNKIRLRNKKGSWDLEITGDLCTAVSGEQQSGTLMQET